MEWRHTYGFDRWEGGLLDNRFLPSKAFEAVYYASWGNADAIFRADDFGHAILGDLDSALEDYVLLIVGRVPMGWDLEGLLVACCVHTGSERILENGHCDPFSD
jgi:hypothetical protein